MKRLLLSLSLLGLLTACTGTEERQPALRLALLLDSGKQLAYTDTAPATAQTGTFTPTLTQVQSELEGRDLHTADGGQAALLTLRAAIERRDVTLNVAQTFEPPFSENCLLRSALSPTRTRLLVLSQCNDAVQRLVLYSTEGTAIWTASLGTAPVPLTTADLPPVNLAVVGDVGVVTRPALGGGSEVIRAAPRLSGDPALDRAAVTTLPETTVAVRDLTLYGTTIYAATDSGIYPLLDTGLPDLTRRITAFGETRYDRIWSGVIGTRPLLLAWRDPTLSGGNDQTLRLWDGETVRSIGLVYEVRDLVVPPDGNLYVLTRTALSSYDAVLGLQTGNWSPRLLLSGLNDAKTLTWLVPQP